MKRKEYSWRACDGLGLFGQSWEPDEKPKAVINIIHGFGEYSGRFSNWAKRFVDKGYAVFAIDYRGHGKSEGKRGYIKNFSDLFNDVDVLLENSKNEYSDIPHLLYGHSLGGNIVTNYYLERKPTIKKLIATSPWYSLAFKPSALLMFFARIMYKISPGIISKSNLDINALSHNKEVVRLYKEDPLVHNKISLELLFSTMKYGSKPLEEINKLNIPMLLMHGSGDKITSFKASKKLYEKDTKTNKLISFKEWPDMYHELHNELINDEIFEYLISWIEK